MLQFPPWKVLLVLAVIAWGVIMSLPNVVNMSGAPSWVPHKAVNLGLDLRGGVYLEMEIPQEDVIGARLSVFARDVRSALARTDNHAQVPHLAEVHGRTMTVKLTRPDAAGNYPIEDAIKRIDRVNGPLEGGLAGGKTYNVVRGGLDSIIVTVPENSVNLMMADALNKTRTIITRRIDPDGVAEISLTPSGSNRLILEAPGEPDPQRLKDLLSRDGRMTFNLVDDSPSSIAAAEAGVPKPGYRLLTGPETGPLLIRDIPELVGSDIATASQGFGDGNRPEINFSPEWQRRPQVFETTRSNVNKRFAIVLDDVIMSAPNIQEPIPGGNVRITGSFTIEEAQDLAAIIAAGEMPAKVQFLDQRVSRPRWVKTDPVRLHRSGRRPRPRGILHDPRLRLAGRLRRLFAGSQHRVDLRRALRPGATLTLPGIAGIILTIGMAVDANVLVFERIREEQRSYSVDLTAVQAGYERALITILDSNLTTLFAAGILYFLGSGPVKGFAVTLAFGIITSVFTAFIFTRMLTVFWIKIAKPKRLAI